MGLREDAESLGITWCGLDDCPATICGGPYVLYENDNGDACIVPSSMEPPLGFHLPLEVPA
jgi:hypothetical protein